MTPFNVSQEERGWTFMSERLVGFATPIPPILMAYDDGEVRQSFSLCFRARLLGGQASASSPEI